MQNADPNKEVVALGQNYFAIQTRKQEITEQEYDSLSDDEKRFYQRKLTKQGNYTLQKVASAAGVKNMAEFHNAGYKGLYNGETAYVLKEKELKENLDSINCKLQDIEKSNNESKDVYDKLKEIEKIINEPTTLTEFNREIFDTIVEKIIVGEVSENGEVKPNVIRFVLNTGAEYRTLLNNNRNKNVSLCTKARRNANT